MLADGDGEDCFKETAEKVGELKTNLIVAEVGKQEYGDEENKALHERFNIDKDAWPVYKLFPKVRAHKSAQLPGVWSGRPYMRSIDTLAKMVCASANAASASVTECSRPRKRRCAESSA